MAHYIIRRLLWTIPTIFLIISLTFVFIKMMPGDPVLDFLSQDYDFNSGQYTAQSPQKYQQTAELLGLDRPTFYFSIVPGITERKIFDLPLLERKFAQSMLRQKATMDQTNHLIAAIHKLGSSDGLPNSQRLQWETLQSFTIDSTAHLLQITQGLINSGELNAMTRNLVRDLSELLLVIPSQPRPFGYFIPKLAWHGFDNQFHHWVLSGIKMNLGTSIVDGQPVWEKIKKALVWTLLINLISIILAYGVAIPLGTYAGWLGGRFDSITSGVLYVLYSLPVFWLTTVLVVFFTTDEYGNWTNLLPATGIMDISSTDTYTQTIFKNLDQLCIPVIVMSTALMAYISRQMRSSVIQEKEKTYVWHAKTRGLNSQNLLWKHVFRNASFPLITMFAYLVPAAIAGSLVVEVICNIPGAGRLMYESIFNNDWQVVLGVVMISGILTVLGMLLSDIAYKWADPRVTFNS